MVLFAPTPRPFHPQHRELSGHLGNLSNALPLRPPAAGGRIGSLIDSDCLDSKTPPRARPTAPLGLGADHHPASFSVLSWYNMIGVAGWSREGPESLSSGLQVIGKGWLVMRGYFLPFLRHLLLPADGDERGTGSFSRSGTSVPCPSSAPAGAEAP